LSNSILTFRMWEKIVVPIMAFLPAFSANPIAAVSGGGPPIDMGRRFLDGRPILGKGKTWRGFAAGVLGGWAVGLLFGVLLSGVPWAYPGVFHPLVLAFGSMLGDSVGSFLKRRLGMESGAKAPLIDFYGFSLTALLLYFLVYPDSFAELFYPPWGVLVILALTPILHRGVNILGYRLGLKRVPW